MNSPLVLFGFIHTSYFEIVSFGLAITMVLLNIRQSSWTWLFSISASALYAVVFFEAKLYGDMCLSFFFITVSLWGWYQWVFVGRAHHGIASSMLARRGIVWTLLAWLVAWGVIYLLLSCFTDSNVPRIDAFLTGGSLVGQFLLSRKKLENWYMWIVIDTIFIGLYIHKHLYLTALLYALFVVLATFGLFVWKKALAGPPAEEGSPA